jgi:hypothetical protein
MENRLHVVNKYADCGRKWYKASRRYGEELNINHVWHLVFSGSTCNGDSHNDEENNFVEIVYVVG